MIDDARRLIADRIRIVSFSGAGLSAESGIPTFRDKDTGGFWVDYDPMKLATPEGFAADPDLVYRWYNDRRRGVAGVQPNAAHRALAVRADIVNITQNIDDLLQRAGADRIIQLHGTLAKDQCNSVHCGHTESVRLEDPPMLRRCPQCGDWMRPQVVWFGEMLPADAWDAAERACSTCDALLVIGTSAEVYPAAGLIGLAKTSGAVVIVINTQPSDASVIADLELIGPAGEVLPRLLSSAPNG